MNFFMPVNPVMMNSFNPFANYFAPQQQSFPTIFNIANNYNPYYQTNSQSIFPINGINSNRISYFQSTPTITKSTESSSVETEETISKPVTKKQNKTYNKVKGEKLAKKIVENLPTDRDPEKPLCAKYVKNAVADCGLGEYVKGNGAYCKNIFRANPNFKEVKTKDFSKLPAGSIVVYNANDTVTYNDGSQGKIGKDGHVLVALGDGRGCSDIMENEIGYSKNAYTFIPV
jgi:hypothetical protein